MLHIIHFNNKKTSKVKYKKIFLFIGIFLCFWGNAHSQNSLIINSLNNTNKGIALSNIDKITFSGGNMNVNKTDVSFENLLLTDIRKITFGTLSGTNPIVSDKFLTSFFPNPSTNYITIRNPLQVSLNFCITTLEGRKIFQKQITTEFETIDISKLSKGIYLLKMNDVTQKLIKQ